MLRRLIPGRRIGRPGWMRFVFQECAGYGAKVHPQVIQGSGGPRVCKICIKSE
ncbi:MAG: hypothetical protein O9327_17515 [Polaromonas sp.]|nr:hypothetical protein [Polaromonas sp.]